MEKWKGSCVIRIQNIKLIHDLHAGSMDKVVRDHFGLPSCAHITFAPFDYSDEDRCIIVKKGDSTKRLK